MFRLTATLIFVLLPLTLQAQTPWRELSPGLFLLPGQLQESQSPDGNSLVIKGTEGLLVVDTGRGGQHTRDLLALVGSLNLPVRAVVNSHWHLDHIGGNASFKRAFPEVRILAHPSLDAALSGFHADNRAQLEEYLKTVPADAPVRPRLQAELDLLRLDRELAETEAVTEPVVVNLGERVVQINVSSHSVTEGDLWLFDAASKTLISGDLVTLPVPLFDTACPEGWNAALTTLGASGFETLVPGHGEPMNRTQFLVWRGGFERLLACSANPGAKPRCINGWFEDAKAFVTPDDVPYARELLAYYFDNNLHPLAPGRRKWCAANAVP